MLESFMMILIALILLKIVLDWGWVALNELMTNFLSSTCNLFTSTSDPCAWPIYPPIIHISDLVSWFFPSQMTEFSSYSVLVFFEFTLLARQHDLHNNLSLDKPQ